MEKELKQLKHFRTKKDHYRVCVSVLVVLVCVPMATWFVSKDYYQKKMDRFVFKHLEPYRPDAGAWNVYPELLVTGAELLPDQMIEIMTYLGDAPAGPPIVAFGQSNITQHLPSAIESIQRLGKLLIMYNSDKASFHKYHVFYAHILESLVAAKLPNRAITTLEVGLGTNNPSLISSMGAGGSPGSSTRAFRDFLPSDSRIYGADVDRDILFEEDRIKTAYVNELEKSSFDDMINDLGESSFDLIIDDALHSMPSELALLLFGLKHVRPGGWVVIEDIFERMMPFWTSAVDAILRTNPAYKTAFVKHEDDCCYGYLVHRLELLP